MGDQQTGILVGKAEGGDGREAVLTLRYANRHGLIAGATGTGKTVTLQSLAEGFSRHGVPVVLADVKGDLSGLAVAGSATGKVAERVAQLGLADFTPRPFPVVFWDLFGKQGHPVRTTISEMGPLLLGRLLELNDTQEGVLHVAFAVADDEGMLLLDLKDLRAILAFIAENAKTLQATYGNIGASSVGAIQRKLLVLEREGGETFFGEPALALTDLMRADNGLGAINVIVADTLINRPRLYSTFLLWLLSELFEELPEVGDRDKPKLVFFFDEAHLLFEDAPKALLDKIEQVVRLIRSKGVGVYFISQNPTDLPDDVLSQLGNRVQHALRAFTERDRKAVRAAAATFRTNPKFDAEAAVMELGVGEALVSMLEGNGTPGIVERVLIVPPESCIGPASEQVRAAALRASPIAGAYDQPIDRISAYEQLKQRAEAAPVEERVGPVGRTGEMQRGDTRPGTAGRPTRRKAPGMVEALATSAARSIGSRLGREIVRGLLGSLLRR
jgi:DNA helicase HerA-like ATPase